MLKKVFLVLISVTLSAGFVRSEFQYIPLFTGDFGVGNASFEGQAGSADANLSLDFAPAMRFSESTSLIPRLSYGYSGVRAAQEIADYGYLFQQYQNTLFSVKLLHKFIDNGIKLRCEFGSKTENARESRDEAWGTGLYNNNNTFFNIGAEKEISKGAIGLGIRTSSFKFPNYKTIASAEGLDYVGTYTFDNSIARFYINGDFSFYKQPEKRLYLGVGLNSDTIDYPDQKLYTEEPNVFKTEKRKDLVTDLNITLAFLKYGNKRDSTLGFRFGSTSKNSNQNYLEIRSISDFTYFADYYDYSGSLIEPYFVIKFHPKDISLRIGYEITTKNYAQRFAQEADGDYLTDKAYTKSNTLSFSFVYPLAQRWQITFGAASRTDSSNILYEQFYKYNFKSSNFFLGTVFEY